MDVEVSHYKEQEANIRKKRSGRTEWTLRSAELMEEALTSLKE